MTVSSEDDWLEGLPDGDADLLDKNELARLLGVAPKEVVRWQRDGCPCHGTKRSLRYRASEIVPWLLSAKGDDALAVAKTKQAVALARKHELDVAEQEGRLVDFAEVIKRNADHMARLQSDLLAIPPRCPSDVQEVVRAAIIEAINKLAEDSHAS